MSEETKNPKEEGKFSSGLSRRDFLKGAATGVVGVTIAGAIGACENPVEYRDLNDPLTADSSENKWKFEIPPSAVSDSLIDEAHTVTADIVVIGSGISGLCTAVAAAEEGKDVRLFSAGRTAVSRGGSNFAIGSAYQSKLLNRYNARNEATDKDYPIPVTANDIVEHIQAEQLAGLYAMDKIKWSRWFKWSGKSMDWMINKMYNSSKQLRVCIEPPYPDSDGTLAVPPSTHNFYNSTDSVGGQPFLSGAPLCASAYAEHLEKISGNPIKYSTKALYLVRGTENKPDGKEGKVTAVIAEELDDGYNGKGIYWKYVAREAIVLATGDFSRDRDMMARYSPYAYELFKDQIVFDEPGYDMQLDFFNGFNGLMDGQGQKMGLWVGAAWQKVFPNAPMINMAVPGPSHAVIDNFWGLNLNINGKRFHNENTNFGFGAYSKMNQPGGIAYGVWGANYADTQHEWEQSGCVFMNDIVEYDPTFKFPGYFGEPMDPAQPLSPEGIKAQWAAGAQPGIGFDGNPAPAQYATGETWEALIDNAIKMGWTINKTNALASIARYHQYAVNKRDEEFQVNPDLLYPLYQNKSVTSGPEKYCGPFYMSRSTPSTFLCVTGGLRTNEYLQVCDANDTPIEGLYNTGTMIGDFFAGAYNFGFPGQNLGGPCLTLSYLLGKELAKGKAWSDQDPSAVSGTAYDPTPQVSATKES
ncbi:MAG: FAD-binding protein [Treponema sp.]|jgi:hypothetical protein|nr:FAD-binding protein [Treponema sp.]